MSNPLSTGLQSMADGDLTFKINEAFQACAGTAPDQFQQGQPGALRGDEFGQRERPG
jgi:hypothetical protein